MPLPGARSAPAAAVEAPPGRSVADPRNPRRPSHIVVNAGLLFLHRQGKAEEKEGLEIGVCHVHAAQKLQEWPWRTDVTEVEQLSMCRQPFFTSSVLSSVASAPLFATSSPVPLPDTRHAACLLTACAVHSKTRGV
eukprot:5758561-Pyramimonas_sp.AAC.1